MAENARTLILVRHGQSEWNEKNLFTGWVDVNLTEKGREEARRAGELIREAGLEPTILFTSLLTRAIDTANIALKEADRAWIDARRSWRLNERHYGALQGKNKTEIRDEYGEEQFMQWRRSYDVPPPEIDDDNEFSQAGDPRYRDADGEMPRTECLKDVLERLLPYWEGEVLPSFEKHDTIIVAAHGNSLRALVKHLEDISEDEIAGLNIPTGIPLVYQLDASGKPLGEGEYLDKEAAEAGAAAVATPGNTGSRPPLAPCLRATASAPPASFVTRAAHSSCERGAANSRAR